MSKRNRPILFIALAGVIIWAYVQYTQPSTPTQTQPAHSTHLASAAGAEDYTVADLNAHFSRYKSKNRDAFVPILTPPSNGSSGFEGGWALTGIDSINGEATATIEDNNGNSQFLKPGDEWNGLHVVSIGNDVVELQNSLGQLTQLTFPEPPPDTQNEAAPAPPAPQRPFPNLPGLSLQPMPVPTPPSNDQGSTDNQ